MLSWIFRHRARLAAIYGMAQAPALPGARLAETKTEQPRWSSVDKPGHLVRRGARVELRPMPPRVR